MKKIFLFLLAILTVGITVNSLSAQTTVEILGDAGTFTNNYIPAYTLYNNSLTEQIFTAAEVGMSGSVSSISFYNGGSTKSPNIKIYMVNTNRTTFDSPTSWLDVMEDDLVFDGQVTFTAETWTTIEFTTPFTYDGTSNLGLVVDENMQWSSGLACRVFPTAENSSMYVYSDNTNYNAVGANYTANGRLPLKNQIKLTITPSSVSSCPKPLSISMVNITSDAATISWVPAPGQTAWEVYCGPENADLSQVNWVSATDTIATFTGLTPNTPYTAYVRTVCGTDVSEPRQKNFTTNLIAVQMPFECDFENASVNSHWAIVNGNETNKWYIGSAVNHTANGSNALYISHNNGFTNSYDNNASSAVWAYFDVEFSEGNEFSLSFDYRVNGEGSSTLWDYMKVFIGTPSAVEAGSNTVLGDVTQLGVYNLQDTWQTTNLLLSGSYANSVQRVYFLWANDASAGDNPPAAVDNILLTSVSCARPEEVAVNSITTTSATVDIMPVTSFDTQWEILCVNVNDNSTRTLLTNNPTGNVINNLTPATFYDIFVRTICGEDESSIWSQAITIHTDCAPTLSVPQTWTFEEEWEPVAAFGQNNDAPLCWFVYNGGVSGLNEWNWQHGTGLESHSGLGHAACYTDYAEEPHNDWLITPQLALTGTQMLTFYAQRSNSSTMESDEISIWISDANITLTEPADSSAALPGFTQVFQTEIPLGEYQFYEVPLTGYSGNRHIAFVRRNDPNDGWYLRLDDVTVEEQPTCFHPDNLTVGAISPTQAQLTWSSEVTSFNVYYKASGDTAFTLANAAPISDTSFTITGLSAFTTYSAYVASVCADSSEQPTQQIVFLTPCGALTVTAAAPFVENFDAMTEEIPDCWDNTEGTTTTEYYKWSNYSPGKTGDCVRFNSYMNPEGFTNMLKTPILNISALNNPSLKFSYMNPMGGDFSVYVSTDGGNTYSTAVATGLVGASSWIDVEYPLVNLANTNNVVIVFQATSNYGMGDAYIYLDDVSVDEMSNCLRPNNVVVSEVFDNAITLTWHEMGAATSWNVAYGSLGFTIGEGMTIVPTTDTIITISNLTPGQAYDFYVQANCGESVSEWRGPVHASPGTYIFGKTGSGSITTCGIVIYDDGGFTDNYSNNCDYTLTIYPSEQDSVVSIFGTLNTESNWDYLYIYSGTAVSQSNLLATLTGLQGNFGPYTSDVGPMTLRFTSDGSNVASGFEATVICAGAPTCVAPYDLTAMSTYNSATVSWTSLTENAVTNLYYKEHAAPGYTVVPGTVLSGNSSYVMTNLMPATSYDVYVANICVDGDTLASPVLTFTTPCVTTVVTNNEPFMENFNTLTTGIPVCWDNSEGTTLPDYQKWSYYINGESGPGLRFDSYINPNGNTNILKTPVLDLSAVTAPVVTFDYKNPTGGDFSVFVSTDGGYTYTTQIATGLTGVSEWTEAQLAIPALTNAGNVVIVFAGTSNYGVGDAYIYLDNVFVGHGTSCTKPSNLTVSNMDVTTADLSWTPGASETSWVVEYKQVSATTWTTATTNTPSCHLTNLTGLTEYNVRVKADCGNEVSRFISASFSTPGCNPADACGYTFVFGDGYGDGWNDATLDLVQNGVVVTTLEANNHGGGQIQSYDTLTVFLCNNLNTSLVWHSGAYDDEVSIYLFNPNDSLLYEIVNLMNITSDTLYTFTTDCGIIIPEPTDPTVATDAATDVEQTIATLNGTITNPDSVAITSMGFLWKTTAGDTYTPVTVAGSSLSYVLTGLTPNTEYTYKAFITFNGETAYGEEVTFTTLEDITPEPCNTPTGLTNTNITHESITIAWVAEENVNSWKVQYRQDGATAWNTQTTFTNSYTISGLQPQTTYQIQVQADCGDGTTSEWTTAITATTLVGIKGYLENNVNLYPNPAREYVDIRVDGDLNVTAMEVIDVYGKVVRTVETLHATSLQTARINISGLANGMYFVRVTTDQGVVTKRFVKK